MAAGFLAGRVTQDRGLMSWAAESRRSDAASQVIAVARNATEVPDLQDAWLLPGFSAALQSRSFTDELWSRLGGALRDSSRVHGRDVIADAGRLVDDAAPSALLQQADRVLLVVRPTVRSVHGARSAVDRLRRSLGDLSVVGLVVTRDGPYNGAEVASALELPLVGALPEDRRTADAITDGIGQLRPKDQQRAALLRAARGLAGVLTGPRRVSGAETVGVS